MKKYGRVFLQLAAFLFLLSLTDAFSQAVEGNPAKGDIAKRVVSVADSDQSYALYLPSSYSPGRKWPILYALDPGARGDLPVGCFREGAEKYGYIVAGSNNSKNGPIEIIQDAVNAIIEDTQSRFSLDTGRIYVAGFSGGARAAILAGYALNEKIAGVIVCGGGFPPSMQPSPSMGFPLAIAVGTEDYFFPELRALNRLLSGLNLPHHLEIFQGGHDWPPEPVCTRMLEWMELQAMLSGKRPKDDLLIDRFLAGAIDAAEEKEQSGKSYEACLQYTALVKDFAGLRDVRAYVRKAEQLERSKAYGKALKQEETIEKQQVRMEEALNRLVEDAVNGGDQGAAGQLHSRFADLRKNADQTRSEPDRLIARRVLKRFRIQLGEAVSADFAQKRYRKALLRLELMKQVEPDSFEIYFHIARAYALEGRKKEAIEALRNAIGRGFSNVSVLQNGSDFESLRNEVEYQRIIEDMKGRF